MADHALLSAITEAQSSAARMLTDPHAPKLVAQLVDTATRRGCRLVAGASPNGHQLVGAMLVAARGELIPWSPTTHGDVLVVDAGVASVCGLAAAMHRLDHLSHGKVFGVAVATQLLDARAAAAREIEILNSV